MNDLLIQFGSWMQNTKLGLAIGQTLWGYPYVQLIHFFGHSLWIGTIVMLDLRLLGLAGGKQSVTEFWDQLVPWTWTGLAILVTGGILLFSVAAQSYVQNAAFRMKFPLILIGIAYHVVILRSIPKWDKPAGLPVAAKVAGFVELAIWIGVITAAVNVPNY